MVDCIESRKAKNLLLLAGIAQTAGGQRWCCAPFYISNSRQPSITTTRMHTVAR